MFAPRAPDKRLQARREVQVRQLGHFYQADEDYGRRVANELDIDLSEVVEITEVAESRV